MLFRSVGESSEINYSEPTDVEPPIVEDAVVTEEKGEEAQREPTTAKATNSRDLSPTDGLATVDTPIATGSVSGHTLESIS